MKLSEKDGELFYKLWLPLLDYVNKELRIVPKMKDMAHAKYLEPADVKNVSDALIEHPELIDSYLQKNGSRLNDEGREIVASWKNSIKGSFFIERHLKRGTVLLNDDDVYLVQGIISTLEEMFPKYVLPVYANITLMPFRDQIITDGLIAPYPYRFGAGIKTDLKDHYMAAKRTGLIMTTLPVKKS